MNRYSFKMNQRFAKLYTWWHVPDDELYKMSKIHSDNLSNDDHFIMPLKYHRFDGIEQAEGILTDTEWDDIVESWEFDDE